MLVILDFFLMTVMIHVIVVIRFVRMGCVLLRCLSAVVIIIRFVRMGRVLLWRFITVIVIICRMDMGVIMVMICILHAFHDFLFHRIHIIHHSDDSHAGGIQGCQGLVQPVLHGAAVADQHIGMLNGTDISRGRLKGVAVHAGGDDHLQVHLVSGNLPHKIIIGEQGHCHLQFSGCFRRGIKSPLAFLRLRAAAEKQGYAKKCRRKPCV